MGAKSCRLLQLRKLHGAFFDSALRVATRRDLDSKPHPRTHLERSFSKNFVPSMISAKFYDNSHGPFFQGSPFFYSSYGTPYGAKTHIKPKNAGK